MAPNRSAFLTVAFVALFHPLLAFAQQAQPPTGSQPPWGWPGPWHMWSGGWEFWWILPLFMLFMMLICIAMFFFGHTVGGRRHWGPWEMVDRPFGPGRSSGDPTYSALQILNERLAKGEIQKQEYDEKQAAILSSRQH